MRESLIVRVLLASAAALLLLSVGPGATASTSTPPRNGLIAVSGLDGIYIVDPQAGTSKLMPKSGGLGEPAWAPDGSTLAVTGPYGADSAVYTVKPDGTERELVLENAYSPSWSPDGKQLAALREGDPATALVVVQSDGSDVRRLEAVTDSPYLYGPKWSPDGKLIAFVAVADDGPTVELVSPDGKAASTPGVAGGETGVSWSPDSTRLAFDRRLETKDGAHFAAVVLDLATGREQVYRGEQLGAESPTWSPQGDQLAFLSVSERPGATTTITTTHSCGGESTVTHLWAMSPNGTKAHKLVQGEYYGTPNWGRAPEAVPAAAPGSDGR